MPMGRFLLFSTLGSLPWNLALIYAGFVVGENYVVIERTLKPYEYVIYAIVIGLAALLIGRWWWSKRRRRAAG
jgi:membrane protein DedA with SNARE-associated domain